MLIVSIETSGREGSLALCRGDGSSFEVLEIASLTGRMYSAELVPKLDHMLQKQGFTVKDIEGVAVVSGPGSFTGLRVGLATAKALGEALDIPIATVSMLEALASTVNSGAPVVTALDAQRGEVYVGEYHESEGGVCQNCESLQSVDHFLTWVKAKDPVPAVHTPDDSLIQKLRAEFAPATFLPRADAGVIGRCGFKKLLAGESVTPAEVDANYIRKSDAEIFSAPKLGLL